MIGQTISHYPALRDPARRDKILEKLGEGGPVRRSPLPQTALEVLWKVPLDWAMTQNKHGTALFRLGERESGTGYLDQAVMAYREALKVFTPENAPHYYWTNQAKPPPRRASTGIA